MRVASTFMPSTSVTNPFGDVRGAAGQELLSGRGQLFLERFVAAQKPFDFCSYLVTRRLEQASCVVKRLLIRVNPSHGAFAGNRFDTSDSRSDAALRSDLEDADVAGARHVCAAA
jgi:hypothetical protein